MTVGACHFITSVTRVTAIRITSRTAATTGFNGLSKAFSQASTPLFFVMDLDPNGALPLRRTSLLSFPAKVDVYQRFQSNAADPWGKRV